MKSSLIISFILLCTSTIYAPRQANIIGHWISPKKDFIVETYMNEDKLRAKLVWFKKLDGKKRYDCEIPEDKWIGKDILWDLSYTDGEWSGGKLKDLKSCKSYDTFIIMNGKDELTVTAYVMVRMFGESMTFKRYEDTLPALYTQKD